MKLSYSLVNCGFDFRNQVVHLEGEPAKDEEYDDRHQHPDDLKNKNKTKNSENETNKRLSIHNIMSHVRLN